MDSMSIFPDGEWDSLSRMFFADDQEPDFTLQHPVPIIEHSNDSSFAAPIFYPSEEKNTNVISGIDDSLFYLLQSTNTNLHSFSQDHDHINPYNCNDSSNYIPFMNNPACDESTFSGFPSDMILDEEQESDGIDREDASISVKKLQVKRKVETPDLETGPAFPSKKSRGSSGDANKIKKTHAQSKKKPPPRGNDEVVTDNGLKVQTSSSCSSDAESNATQEQNGGATSDSKGPAATSPTAKTRASRGAASDPQSLYARKRRERINERLRILQGLVPNGTKVDISTMLEEAVHYVKFLQHQIKLLSSDDMWMYAPIAYNGIDIGLDRKAAYPFL